MLQRRVHPAKEYARRTLRVVALVGTLLIAIIAIWDYYRVAPRAQKRLGA